MKQNEKVELAITDQKRRIEHLRKELITACDWLKRDMENVVKKLEEKDEKMRYVNSLGEAQNLPRDINRLCAEYEQAKDILNIFESLREVTE